MISYISKDTVKYNTYRLTTPKTLILVIYKSTIKISTSSNIKVDSSKCSSVSYETILISFCECEKKRHKFSVYNGIYSFITVWNRNKVR